MCVCVYKFLIWSSEYAKFIEELKHKFEEVSQKVDQNYKRAKKNRFEQKNKHPK